MMPLATALKLPAQPLPLFFNALTGRIVVSVTPATPMPLSRSAPTMPATCVPWPQSSSGTPSPLMKS